MEKFGAIGPGVRGSATKEGCACHECGVSDSQGWATRERTHPRNGCVRGWGCRIFDSGMWLSTDRTGWRSDASSPWMRRHTGGSWQDTHGTPVPSLLGRPCVVHDQNRYHKCHKHNVLFQHFFSKNLFAFLPFSHVFLFYIFISFTFFLGKMFYRFFLGKKTFF